MKPNLDLAKEIEDMYSRRKTYGQIRQELVNLGHHEEIVDAAIDYVKTKHKKRMFSMMFFIAVILFIIVFYIGSLFDVQETTVQEKHEIKKYTNNLNPEIFSVVRGEKQADFSYVLDKRGYLYYLSTLKGRWIFFDYMTCKDNSLTILDGGMPLKKYDLNIKGKIKHEMTKDIRMLKIVNNGNCKLKIYNLRVI